MDITALEDAAASLLDFFPVAAYRDSFHVFDFSFYFIQEDVKESYPEALARQLTAVEAKFPYYLLFGRGLNRETGEVKFWVEIKLPTTAEFNCMTAQRRAYYKSFIEGKVNASSTNGITGYSSVEIEAMSGMAKMLKEDFECCYFSRSGGNCNQFLGLEGSMVDLEPFSPPPPNITQGWALTPDGKVIKAHPTHQDGLVRGIIQRDFPYSIIALELWDVKDEMRLIRKYTWDGTNYSDSDGQTLGELVEASSSVGYQVIVAQHLSSSNDCTYKSQQIVWNNPSSNPSLVKTTVESLIDNNQWMLSLFADAPKTCFIDFAKAVNTRDESSLCGATTIDAQTAILLSYSNPNRSLNEKELSELSNKINAYCIDAVRNLDGIIKLKFLKALASQSSILDYEEFAILRLLETFDTSQYEQVYNTLQQKDNNGRFTVLTSLIARMDDGIVWKFGDNYTNFIGALCWMYAQKTPTLDFFGSNGYSNLYKVIDLEPKFIGSLPAPVMGGSSFTIKYYQTTTAEYYPIKGTVQIQECTLNSIFSCEDIGKPISPLEPILVYRSKQELPEVAAALDNIIPRTVKFCG